MGNYKRVLLLCCLLLTIPAWGQEIPVPDTAQEAEEAPAPRIQVDSGPSDDQAIARRLEEIFANLESLSAVEVSVDAGVVTLGGRTPTPSAQREAGQLAALVEGVVAVENRVEANAQVGDRLEFAFGEVGDRLRQIVLTLPLALVALAVVAAFWWFGALLAAWNAPFARLTRNPFLADLFKQISRTALLLIGLLVALEILDATAILGALIGAAGLFGLAMGFALRDTVENYIASVLLSIRQPFSPNDHIRIDSHEGLVVRLTSRATILMTFDGNHIRIPNATVFKGVIINYTRNPQRRFGFEVGVSTEVDLAAARALAVATLGATPGVLSDPIPLCSVKALGDSNVVLEVFGWTDQGRFDFLKVQSAAIQALKEAFDAANYEMPEPIYRLRVQGLEGGVLSAAGKEVERAAPVQQPAEKTRQATEVGRDSQLEEKIARESEASEDLLRVDAPKE